MNLAAFRPCQKKSNSNPVGTSLCHAPRTVAQCSSPRATTQKSVGERAISDKLLVGRAQVHAGQKVVIHAGAGGVGHVAVQIARASGAEVFSTVSPNKKHLVEQFGVTVIHYHSSTVEEYVRTFTGGLGFDIVYETVGGSTIDASFEAVRRYTGHGLSCLGWCTHSLAPLSFRGATYSGVFTLFPMLSGIGLEHHGEILTSAAALADEGKLKPLLNPAHSSTPNIDAAHAIVESGSAGKVVIDIRDSQE